jgi:hypothetical protein
MRRRLPTADRALFPHIGDGIRKQQKKRGPKPPLKVEPPFG